MTLPSSSSKARWDRWIVGLAVVGFVVFVVVRTGLSDNPGGGCSTGASISSPPTDQTVCAGNVASLTVSAGGCDPKSYQWFKNNASISGATSSTLVFNPVSAADEGSYYVHVENNYGQADSATAVLTVNARPTVTVSPTSALICQGVPVTLNASGASTYTWSPSIGLNTNAGPTVTASPSTNTTYTVVGTSVNGCSNTTNVTVTVLLPPSITASPTNWTACAGNSAIFSVSASGASLSYQWRKNGVDLSGQVSPTLTLNNVNSLDASNYSVVVSNSCGSTNSSAASLTVLTPPSITSQPVSRTNCLGETATFSVSATGATSYQWRKNGVNLSNGGSISGVTSNTVTISNIFTNDAGSYTVIVGNTCGAQTSGVATLTAKICDGIPDGWKQQFGFSVADPSVAGADPDNDGYTNLQEYNLDTDPTNSVSHPATIPPYLVGWWKLDEGTGIQIADSSTNNHSGVLLGDNPSNCWITGVLSNALSFDGVNPNWVEIPWSPYNNLMPTQALTVTAWIKPHGAETEVLIGNLKSDWSTGNWIIEVFSNDVFFTLTPNGVSNGSVIEYAPNWFSNAWHHFAGVYTGSNILLYVDGVPKVTNSVSGSVFPVQNPVLLGFPDLSSDDGAVDDVRIYRRALSASEIATLYDEGNCIAPPVGITPSSATICNGGPVTLTASGATTYVWSPAAGLNTNQGSVVVATPTNTITYMVTGTDAAGCVNSNSVTLTVKPVPAITASNNGPICAGQTLQLFASTVTGGTYHWVGPNGFSANVQNPVISSAPATASGIYSVTVTGTNGCTSAPATTVATVYSRPTAALSGSATICLGQPATIQADLTGNNPWIVTWSDGVITTNYSSPAARTITPTSTTNFTVSTVSDSNCVAGTASGSFTINVNLAPSITVSPTNGTACAGNTAVFTALASGIPTPTVQWQVSTDSGANFNDIIGATSTTLGFTTSTSDHNKKYRAVFSNSCGTTNSAAATLIVNTPVITSQPLDQTVTYGGSVTFSVSAFGNGTLTYQWRKNGVNIFGATSGSYTITKPPVSDSGSRYDVVVSYGGCSVASSLALLTVNRKLLTVTAISTNREYGVANPTFSHTFNGFVSGEDTNVLTGVPELSTIANPESSVGLYPITPAIGSLSAANYSFTFVNGSLTITKASLNVTADDKTNFVDNPIPPLTGVITGLRNGDPISATYSTTTNGSPAGNYAIIPSWVDPASKLGNYNETRTNGTLTLTNAPIVINLTSTNLNYMLGRPPTPLNNNISITVNDSVPSGYFTNKMLRVAFMKGHDQDYLSIRNLGTNQLVVAGITNVTDGSRNITNNGQLIGTCKGGTPQEPLIVKFTTTNATLGVVTNVLKNISFYNTSPSPTESSRIVSLVFSNDFGKTDSATKLFAIGAQCPSAIDAILIIDKTGSMISNDVPDAGPGLTNRLLVAKDAATNFLSHLDFSFDLASVIAFPILTNGVTSDQKAYTNMVYRISGNSTNYFTNSLAVLKAAVTNIPSPSGNTIYDPSLMGAYTNNFRKLYGSDSHDSNKLQLVVFITDGWLNPSEGSGSLTTYQNRAIDAARTNSLSGTRVITIGFADKFTSAASNLLWQMSSGYPGSTNDTLIAPTKAALNQKYAEIAAGICRGNFTFSKDLLVYTEKGPATNIDEFFEVTDSSPLSNRTLTVTLSPNSFVEDHLAIRHQGTGTGQINIQDDPVVRYGSIAIGNFTGQDSRTITVTLSNTATATSLQALMRNITYYNSSIDPTDTVRKVTAQLTGSISNTAVATEMDIVVLPVNDAPTLDPIGDMTVKVGAGPHTVGLTGITTGGEPSQFVWPVSATASDTNLIPAIAVSYHTNDATGTLSFWASTNLTGTATITVHVMDSGGTANGGINTFSRTFTVNVVPYQPPSVQIIKPRSTDTFNARAQITLNSLAETVDGVITKVEYYTNGVNNLVGSSTLSPYKLILSGLAGGTYTFTAKAYASSGLYATSAPVTVTVSNLPPTVAITSPLSNTAFALGERIPITAVASSPSGNITDVEFLAGGVKLGNVTSAPYIFTWTNGLPTEATNNLILTAKARDDNDLDATSAEVRINVVGCAIPGISNLSLSVSEIIGGSSLSGTVTLSNAAPTGGQAISLSSSDEAVIPPVFVLVPQSATSASFTIDTLPVISTNAATISAMYHGGSPKTADLAVIPRTDGGTNAVQYCGPMDVVFVIDTTGSMGGPLQSVRDSLTNTLNSIVAASGGDYRLGLVTFKDFVYVEQPLDTSNRDEIAAKIGSLSAAGGDDCPEASDEALNTVINALPAVGRDQSGDFNEFRSNDVRKIVIIITDDVPGGFQNDFYNLGRTNAYQRALEGAAKGIQISSIYVGYACYAETEGVMQMYADVTGGIYIRDPSGTQAGQAVQSILAQCGSSQGRTVFVRDDQNRKYAPFNLTSPQIGAASLVPAEFDTVGIWGSVTGARIQRAGMLQVTLGSQFDVELGVSSSTNGTGGFGLLLPNAQQLATTDYAVEWSLPVGFYADLQAQLSGICSLPLSNHVSSACGETYTITDTPQANWPSLEKNILTLAVATDQVIPQGRCRSFTLNSTNAPVNGTWDIVFRDQIIGSSGKPNGWDVEEDYTYFGGFTVTVPTNAVADDGYEVRVRQPDWSLGRSTRFSVVRTGSIPSAPVLLPMRISTNSVGSGSTTSASLIVALDAPAPFGDAHVVLKTGGPAGVNVPAEVIIPTGQTSVTNTIQVGGSSPGMQEIFASYNGYRKAKVRVTTGGCTVTSPSPTTTVVQGESTILVSWGDVPNALSYTLQRKTNGGSYLTIFSGLATNQYVDTDVVPLVVYSYQVKSVGDGCESGWSEVSDVSSNHLQNPNIPPAPWFSPYGGTFNDSVTVVITNYFADSTIYYTTNGVPPLSSSGSGTFTGGGTITLTNNIVLKADLTNPDYGYGQHSRVVSANFTIITPSLIGCGSITSGSLTRTNAFSPVDGPGFYASRYKFTTDVGKSVTITAHSDDFDTYLYLKEGENVVAVNDDYLDDSTDSQIVFRVPTNAVHEIEVTSYWPGQTGNFTLELLCTSTPGLVVLTNAVVSTNSPVFPNAGLIDFGVLTANVSAARSIIVSNSGSGNLDISSLSITQSANGFSMSPPAPLTISQGNTRTLTLGLLGTQVGDYSGYLIITNNDAARNPFYVKMVGRVRAAAGPPEVSIYFPTNGTAIPDAPVHVDIAASAWDEDGIQKVEFYTNSILYQTVSAWPYIVTWSNVTAGSHTVSAIAYDKSTPQQWSTNSVSFIVGLPTLTLTPTNACVGLSNTAFTATALVKNASGSPSNNVTVTFTVTGAHNTTGTATTGSGGTATFTYTGTNYGPDRIKATTTLGGRLIETEVIVKNWARNINCNDIMSGALSSTSGYSVGCQCAEPSRYADFYSFIGTNGQDVTITMSSTNFEPIAVLLNTNCTVLVETNDALSATNTQIRYTLTPTTLTNIIETTSYDFFQTGSYTLKMQCGQPPAPRMNVLLSGTNVPNYGMIDLGVTNTGQTISRTIIITNQGTASLLITNKSLAPGFAINLSPTATISAGTSASYDVTFTTNNPGIYQGYVALWNNDNDRNPYVLNLKAVINAAGTAPNVNILVPTNGTQFIAPAGFDIQAQASASGGAHITNVDFYAISALGSVKIGSTAANSSLFSTSIGWTVATPGNYALQAVAFDNAGRAAVSPAKLIQVYPSNQNHPPVASNDTFSVNMNSINNDLSVLANDSDPDGDPLTITSVTPPSVGTVTIINGGAAVRYTTKPFTAGSTSFLYTISDGRGGTATAAVSVKIEVANVPKVAITGPIPTNGSGILYAGDTTNLTVSITDTALSNIDKVEYYLGPHIIGTVTNIPFTLSWLVRKDPSCDCRNFQAAAYDKYGQRGVSDIVEYTIVRTNQTTTSLFADIQSPAPVPYTIAGQTQYNPPTVSDGILVVTGSVYEVDGTAHLPAEYRLLIETPDGSNVVRDTGWLTAAAMEAAALKTFDLTTVENGPYDLELQVRNSYSIVSKTVRFILDSQLKVGQFSFSQQDVVVPMAGIPLSVIRTYNSLNAQSSTPNADFGPGWTYALKDMDVQIDELREETYDEFDDEMFSMRVGGGRNVTLTLPDGRRATFAFRYKYQTVKNDNTVFVFGWDAPLGVNYQLKATASTYLIAPFGSLSPFWEDGNYGGPNPDVNYDFPGFVLTAPDGTKYNITRERDPIRLVHAIEVDQGYQVQPYGPPKLTSIELPDGNTLTFNDDGVTHSAGKSLVFQRDFRGRISAIIDPAGQQSGIPVVKYGYDNADNLAVVSNLVTRGATEATSQYAVTTYLYENTNFKHYITAIKDPRGVTPLRNLYDDSGKLIGVIDAFGKTNRFVHDVTGRIETVYDRMGNPTIHEYDARGNVTKTIDALGEVTERKYDGANNLTEESVILSAAKNLVTKYTYDDKGNRTNVTDAAGRVNSFTYDAAGNQLKHTDPLGNVTSNVYDNAGHLLETLSLDPQGNVVTKSSSQYDSAGNLTTNKDALGRVTASFGYDGSGNLTSATDASGFTRNFAYDNNGNQTNTSYVWTNPVAQASPPVAVATSTFYDSAGRVTRTIDADGQTNVTVYNEIGKVASTTNKFGLATSYTYDARGNLVQTVYPDNTVTRTVYDDDGRATVTGDRVYVAQASPPAAVTFPRATRTYYDAVGRAIATVRLTNVVVELVGPVTSPGAVLSGPGTAISSNTTEYLANGWVKSRTGPDGQTTRYEYYDDGQLKAVIDPLGKRTEYEYDPAGRRELARDALQRVTQFEYDAVGRVLKTVFGDGRNISSTYNQLGQKVAETDQAGQTTTFGYNTSGLLTNVTKPFVPDPENGNQMTAPRWDFEYDPYGRLLDTRDPKGRITTNAYDFAGRPVEFRLPMGQIATNQYDSFGRLWKKYDFKGQLEQLSYDSLGRVQSREFYTNNASQLAKRICISYDELGRQKKIVELTGNALGNSCATVLASLKSTGWPGVFAMLMPMLGLIALPRYSLRYSLRRLRLFLRHPILSVCHSERSEESLSCGCRHWEIERLRALRGYRPMRRCLRLICLLLIPVLFLSFLSPGPEVFAAPCVCTPGSANNDIRITEFTYDADGHITQICSPEGAVNYEYDTATGRHTRTWTTNNDTRYSYDELGRLKTVEVYKRNGVTLTTPEVTTYTYTAVGSRESVTLPNGTKTTYTYDSLNRLKKLETRNASNVLLSRYEYTLHETGRRIGATEIILQEDDASYRTNVISWAYDGMYRLTNETRIVNGGTPTTDSYSYDLAGNRKQKSGTGVPPVAYSYNANDQLLSETTGTLTTSYLYDANGSLTNKTVTSGSSYAYTYDVQNRLASVSVDGGPATSFVYDYSGIRVRAGNRYFLVDPLNPTGYAQVLEEGTVSGSTFTLSRSYVLGDDVLAQVTGSTTQYLLYDGHGSTRQLSQTTTTGGTHVVEHYNYDAYGVGLGLPSSPATSYLYAGEQWDANARQYYLRARYYDPATGRFTQPDPISGSQFDPASLHKYAYCHGDPVDVVDPSGQQGLLVELLTSFTIRAILFRAAAGAILGAFDAFFRGYPIGEGAVGGAIAGVIGPRIPWRVGIGFVIYGVGEALWHGDYDSALYRAITAGFGFALQTRGFRSFNAFKQVFGRAAPGEAWHHIVEQTPGNVGRFGAEAIHNPNNLIPVEHGAGTVHAKISGFYSSKQPQITGSPTLTVREWLAPQSYSAQYQFGLETLKAFGGGSGPPNYSGFFESGSLIGSFESLVGVDIAAFEEIVDHDPEETSPPSN